MWGQWKKKLRSLFATESFEGTETKTSVQQKQDIETKVMYQYPTKTPFRFPLIPDTVEKKDISSSTPAYQRRNNKNNGTNNNLKQRYQKEPVSKANKNAPFTPSQVASPIYGYQQRKKTKEIENIPTYIRNQQNDELVEERESELSTVDQTAVEEPSPEMAQPDMARQKPDPRRQELEPGRTKPVQTSTLSSSQNRSNKSSKRANNRRKNKHKHKRLQNKTQKMPYNVMMTPQDKRNLTGSHLETKKGSQIQNSHQNSTLPYHLLNDPEETTSEDQLWVQSQQELLERTFKHFNVQAKVVKATQGPSVTRFEVHPELGVKVSKIKNLSDDIKLNMSAKDIRIEAPIPGKNTIGIEVPNIKAQMVGLQEIFESETFKQNTESLTIGLGLSVEGLPIVTNISKMPHGLIAGATGSGKSVCINTILISLLYKADPEDVKFLLIDPKMVELAAYNGLPHLVSPVITDVKAATAALKWAVGEMEERYEKFVQEGVRDIKRFNKQMIKQNRSNNKMPFIVIVIDELADLMMASPQDVEDAICRIAQKARACGIHLLLATQRPSVDVITGLIKANIPTRIAFSVSSQVDSRTILDANGAERLLGKGDMLFIENGSGKSIRLQGAFVSDDEIERITAYVKASAPPNYLFAQDQLLQQVEMDEQEDELLEKAISFVLEQDNASTSLLQRQFRIGYNRAARLINTLESKGIISGQNGSKPRDVLVSEVQMEELK